jgi:predicted phage terminase large subunit-like protein
MTEKMIDLMAAYQTQTWWAARDAISGSIKPFLMKRMKERQVYRHVDDDIREDKDLVRRSQSIRSRMSMGMVRWPKFAPWWPQAQTELLQFPNGKNDDLVAALAMLGMGMDRMITADANKPKDLPKPGTYAWHTYGQDKSEPVKGWA